MIHKENGVWTYPDGRQVCDKTAAGVREYKRRTEHMRQRQNCRCAICNHFLAEREATCDHSKGRGMGGGHRDDRVEIDGYWNNAALHNQCNVDKGSQRYGWVGGMYVPDYSEDVYETPDVGPIWAEGGEK
jgi:hypothetical protein